MRFRLSVARIRSALRWSRRAALGAMAVSGNLGRALLWFLRRPSDVPYFVRLAFREVSKASRRRLGAPRRLSMPGAALAAAAPVRAGPAPLREGFDWVAAAPFDDADMSAACDPAGAGFPAGCGLRVSDIWLTGDRLSLRLDAEEGADRQHCVLRVLQFGATGCSDLGSRPVSRTEFLTFVELSRCDGFSPLRLELRDPDGGLVDAGWLAFPSLARGGAHYGELCAIAGETPYPASLERESVRLASRLWRSGGALHLRRVMVDPREATGAERIFAPDARRWLSHTMGCEIVVDRRPDMAEEAGAQPCDDAPRAAVAPGALADRREAGGTLRLPADGLPTIGALTAPAVPEAAGGSAQTGALVLAAEGRERIALIDATRAGPALVGLQPRHARPALPVADPALAREHGPLAIRFTHPELAGGEQALFPTSPFLPDVLLAAAPAAPPPMTVLFQALGDIERDVRALEALRRQRGIGPLNVLARGSATQTETEGPLATVLDQLFPRAWRILSVSPGALLTAAPDVATVALLDGAVTLHDVRTLATLALLAAAEDAASASCALVRVTVNPKQPTVGAMLPPFATPAIRERGSQPDDSVWRLGPSTLGGFGADARLAVLPGAALVRLRDVEVGAETTLQAALGRYCARASAAALVHYATTAIAASLHGQAAAPAWPPESRLITELAP